jgi:hypothetical protein
MQSLLYSSLPFSSQITSSPSLILDSPCSDRGTCTYRDPSGNTLQSCTILDYNKCFATCVCLTGYGGADCSISVSKRDALSDLRWRTKCFYVTVYCLKNNECSSKRICFAHPYFVVVTSTTTFLIRLYLLSLNRLLMIYNQGTFNISPVS